MHRRKTGHFTNSYRLIQTILLTSTPLTAVNYFAVFKHLFVIKERIPVPFFRWWGRQFCNAAVKLSSLSVYVRHFVLLS
jgi:hypothetical protein